MLPKFNIDVYNLINEMEVEQKKADAIEKKRREDSIAKSKAQIKKNARK